MEQDYTNLLEISHVTKRYGKVTANQDISFGVPAGQIAILMGPNGAGKSTLIKCITGLLRFQGSITVGGHPNSSLEAKRLIGYVPEIPALYDALSVSEHLEFIRRAYRAPDDGLGESLLRRFELWDKRDKTARELSKGMQQKLSVCCALVHRPGLVIFDEPMVGLDPYAIKEIKALFGELRDAGTAVLISTHMIDSVEDYWDAVHIMNRGELAATRHNTAEETHEQSLEELFFAITGSKNPAPAAEASHSGKEA